VALLGIVAGVFATTAPAWRGDLTTGRTFASVPGYWAQTADWLDAAGARGRALVLPGASFGSYLWGQSRDEPLQVLARTPWGVRDAVPLSSAGNIRSLDEVEALLSDGRGDPQLAAFLARMGVSFVVVRNDLDATQVDSPRPSLVNQALAQSPDIVKVVGFGPFLAAYSADGLVVDAGVDGNFPAVEIYQVTTGLQDPRAVIRDASNVDVVDGEPESMLGVVGLPGESGRTVVRSGDLPAGLTPGRAIMTDTGRRVEVDFGRVHDNRSSTLTDDDAWTLPRKAHDYEVAPSIASPRAVFPGHITVTASSSRGDAASLAIVPSSGPWNAVDHDVLTAWLPRTGDRNPWWEAHSHTPLTTASTRVVPTTDPPGTRGVVSLRFVTDTGSRDVAVTLPIQAIAVPADLAPSTSLRIVVLDASGIGGARFGIAEVSGLGVSTERSIATTSATLDAPASALSLRVRHGQRSACVARYPTNCLPSLARSGEEVSGLDRTVSTSGIDGPVEVQVTPRPGSALDRLLLPLGGARAVSSGQWVSEPSARAQAAIDRDPWTAWIADPLDRHPTLSVTLEHPASVSWLRILETLSAGVSQPLAVDVTVGGRTYSVLSDREGYLRFPHTRTSTIRLTVRSSVPVLTYDSALQVRSVLPVGISDLVLGEADNQRRGVDRRSVVTMPCGFAPSVLVTGQSSVPTTLQTTVGQILDGAPAVAHACGPSRLGPGAQRVVVKPSSEFDVVGLTWVDAGASGTAPQEARILSWTATERTVVVTAAPVERTLELAENDSSGWIATVDGEQLTPLRVDGWRQAWLVPPGLGGEVELTIAPDHIYRTVLVIGATLVVVLVALVSFPVRRRQDLAVGVRSPASRTVRLLAAVAVSALAFGPAGVVGSLVGSAMARDRRRQAVVAAGGVVMATVGAVVSPWPTSTTWTTSVAVAAAVVVSAASGTVLGALLAGGVRWRGRVRTDAPTVEPDVPPIGT
jgi:arabinofuranan 3-O-arabinosyltransferase